MLTIFLLCALFALSGATEPQVETRAEQHPPLDKVVSAAHEERPEELLASGRLEEEEAQAQEAAGAEELGNGVESRSRCLSGWSQYGSRCFVFQNNPKTWTDAEQHCLNFGANLASIHSFGEYQFIQEMVRWSTGSFSRTWIGGTDAVKNFVWFWSDGSRFDYKLWASGEPTNYGNTEHCVEINCGAFQNLQTLS
ncbi:ladderlectin-like [Centroberyx affinis]|uniref:ladderlectin-like n=1 Tax=Centroberyx affinis TaxID=166261 RepID=UPI003A5C2F8E